MSEDALGCRTRRVETGGNLESRERREKRKMNGAKRDTGSTGGGEVEYVKVLSHFILLSLSSLLYSLPFSLFPYF